MSNHPSTSRERLIRELVNQIGADHWSAIEAAVDLLLEIIDDAVREHAEIAPHAYPDGSTS